ncbi:MAG: PD-(D/E)XK nuclease family protein, partial [Candidatus Omnitrophota bacterium]
KIGKIPTYVEKEFSFPLGNNRIIGRWDRVDIEKEKVTIIDFKSSEIKVQKDADKKAKDSLQLSLYALAYKTMYGVMPDNVELHFLESDLVGRAERKDQDLDELKDKINKVSSGIRNQVFEAKPVYLACTWCAFNQICPAAIC